MRAIDADELLKVTVKRNSIWNSITNSSGEGLEEIINNQPTIKIPKWIPSERLPITSGVYIVSKRVSDGEESAILTDANYYDGCGEWYNDNRINWDRELVTDKIVAWMPLPEPYKAESEDNK